MQPLLARLLDLRVWKSSKKGENDNDIDQAKYWKTIAKRTHLPAWSWRLERLNAIARANEWDSAHDLGRQFLEDFNQAYGGTLRIDAEECADVYIAYPAMGNISPDVARPLRAVYCNLWLKVFFEIFFNIIKGSGGASCLRLDRPCIVRIVPRTAKPPFCLRITNPTFSVPLKLSEVQRPDATEGWGRYGNSVVIRQLLQVGTFLCSQQSAPPPNRKLSQRERQYEARIVFRAKGWLIDGQNQDI